MNWKESKEAQEWREKRESLVVDIMTRGMAHQGLLANQAYRWVLRVVNLDINSWFVKQFNLYRKSMYQNTNLYHMTILMLDV